MSKLPQSLIPAERIEHTILLIRGQRVILDRELSLRYGVSTKVLNQAVRRNLGRFPEDFMFQLTKEEFENWRSQFAIANPAVKMQTRYLPTAFTAIRYAAAGLECRLSLRESPDFRGAKGNYPGHSRPVAV